MSEISIADLIREGTQLLQTAERPDAHHDARALLSHVLKLESLSAALLTEKDVSQDQAQAFLALVARRAQGEPLQHIVGHTSIYELTIKSDARALIPRQDSAELISLAIECLQGRQEQDLTIADLGAGSGVLLAECLHRFKRARGIAVEQDPAALSLATENFSDLGVVNRIDVFEGSWADWSGWATCDLILSNPPYIRSDVLPTLEPEVRDHDPLAALDGGPDGLTAYREIIPLAAAHMTPGAYLAFEIGFDQKQTVSTLLLKAGFTDLRHRKDLSGQDRAIAAIKS